MRDFEDKRALVIGLGRDGQAACQLLAENGAVVTAVDPVREDGTELAVAGLPRGIDARLGANELPEGEYECVVATGDNGRAGKLALEAAARGLNVISDLELGYEMSYCLFIAIAGTNGKTSVARLIERVLQHRRKTMLCGGGSLPVCEAVSGSRELDFLLAEIKPSQLERIQYFRPAVALLMNLTLDDVERYPRVADQARAQAALFRNQQAFDWAIVQSEALAQVRSLNLPVPGKVITFSAQNRRADIYLDRGLLISQLPGWTGPLLDMDHCRLNGPHQAENLMAALAVGRVLRMSLDETVAALKESEPEPFRCELMGEIGGVQVINDAYSTNLDALQKAILSVRQRRQANIWLIAGGKETGLEYHDVGPLLAERVKQAFLLGESRDRIRAAWSLFTPCTAVDSLLEAVQKTIDQAVPGDVLLFSPASSSADMFRNEQHRGEVFRQTVEECSRAMGSVARARATTGSVSKSRLSRSKSESE